MSYPAEKFVRHSFLYICFVNFFQNTALSGKKSMITCFEAHNNAIFDVAWIPGSRSQVITVSGDQSDKLWDISNVTTSTEVEEIRSFL